MHAIIPNFFFIRKTKYHKWIAVPNSVKKKLFFPNIGFLDTKHIETQSVFGPTKLEYFWIKFPHHLEYVETQIVISYCKFNFKSFPFDSHDCDLMMRNNVFGTGRMILENPEIIYHEAELNQKSEKVPPFDISVKSIVPIFKVFHGYNYSITGISLHFKRNSLGLLIGKFYGPSAIFSLLSVLSYTISIENVSYRM